MLRSLLAVLTSTLVCFTIAHSQTLLEWTDAERTMIEAHGPWPPPFKKDPSNRFSGNSEAIELGEQIFFDARLSANNKISCATCHVPKKGFADGLAVGKGFSPLIRNTQSVFNLRWNTWFGWGGENDSLWAQSVRPITMKSEMAGSHRRVADLLKNDPKYSCQLKTMLPEGFLHLDDETLFVMAGKFMAAYMEILVTQETPFDYFRKALLQGDHKSASQYPGSAQRGLKIFAGRGKCSVCHFGPLFTNGEFGDVGIPYFIEGGVDKGRYSGIQSLKTNPYNRLGKFSDDPTQSTMTQYVRLQHRNFGEFRVPSLRNVEVTAPYMHNGSLQTLEEVIRHYSELNMDRLHADGETLLKPLKLSEEEIQDVVDFLKTLTAPVNQSTPEPSQHSCKP